ncbi:MAG: hypothetical protein IAF94_17000 [Pirellulaceae bacterium]|nr:hypothetical protein [Pirellulaceae bacterium]
MSASASSTLTGSASATFCNAAALFLTQIAIPIGWTVVADISGKHRADV